MTYFEVGGNMKGKIKRILSAILAICMVWQITSGILPVPVNAWKTKTHNYTAQLLMQEMQANYINGAYYIEIPPYGKFMVPHEFANAIMEYPAAFSAGSQGPDAYPDLYVGQTYIHPYDSTLEIGSGEWIEHMCNVVNSLPKGYARDEALALTLGFINHYCGDMFGHDYINSYAKGSFPDIMDGVDEQEVGIIVRHLSTETKMDSYIPKTFNSNEVDAPEEFLMGSLIYDGHPNNGISSLYERFEDAERVPYHYQYLLTFRKFLYETAEEMRASIEPEAIAAVAYLDCWIEDIDKSIYGLTEVSDKIAQDLLRGVVDPKTGEHMSDIEVFKVNLIGWLEEYGVYITPLPDIFGDVYNASKEEYLRIIEYMEMVARKMFPTVADIYDTLNEMFTKLETMILEELYSYILGEYFYLNYEDLRDGLKEPSGVFFDEEVLAQYAADMLVFKENAEYAAQTIEQGTGAVNQDLAAFYNTLTMMKLVLIGADNFSQLLLEGANVVQDTYQTETASVMADTLTVSIHTSPEPFSGTDDDILIRTYGVNSQTGEIYGVREKLLDTPLVNDFETNTTYQYTVELGMAMPISEVRFDIIKRKVDSQFNFGGDWRCESITVSPMRAGIDLGQLYKKEIYVNRWFTETNNQKSFNPEFKAQTYTTYLDSDVIDFMQSLDNSGQWRFEENILWSNENVRKNIFFRIFKGFTPEITLTSDSRDNGTTKQVTLTAELVSVWNGVPASRRAQWFNGSDDRGGYIAPVTGTVDFYLGDQLLGTAEIDEEQKAVLTVNVDMAGDYDISARYSGDSLNAPTAHSSEIRIPGGTIRFTQQAYSLPQITVGEAYEYSLLTVENTGKDSTAEFDIGTDGKFLIALDDDNAVYSEKITLGPIEGKESVQFRVKPSDNLGVDAVSYQRISGSVGLLVDGKMTDNSFQKTNLSVAVCGKDNKTLNGELGIVFQTSYDNTKKLVTDTSEITSLLNEEVTLSTYTKNHDSIVRQLPESLIKEWHVSYFDGTKLTEFVYNYYGDKQSFVANLGYSIVTSMEGEWKFTFVAHNKEKNFMFVSDEITIDVISNDVQADVISTTITAYEADNFPAIPVYTDGVDIRELPLSGNAKVTLYDKYVEDAKYQNYLTKTTYDPATPSVTGGYIALLENKELITYIDGIPAKVHVNATDAEVYLNVLPALGASPAENSVVFGKLPGETDSAVINAEGYTFREASAFAEPGDGNLDIRLMQTAWEFPEEVTKLTLPLDYEVVGAVMLDFVNAANGNILAQAQADTASSTMELLIPYPEGTDRKNEFAVIYFDGIPALYATSASYSANPLFKTDAGLVMEVEDASSYVIAVAETVEVVVEGGSGSGTYNVGEYVTIKAQYEEDQAFQYWNIEPETIMVNNGSLYDEEIVIAVPGNTDGQIKVKAIYGGYYTVKVSDAKIFTVDGSYVTEGRFAEGSSISIFADVTDEKVFKEWQIVSGEVSLRSAQQIDMIVPGSDVELRAIFYEEDEEHDKVSVSASVEGGTIRVGGVTYPENYVTHVIPGRETVAMAFEPYDGYVFTSVSVNGVEWSKEEISTWDGVYEAAPDEALIIHVVCEWVPVISIKVINGTVTIDGSTGSEYKVLVDETDDSLNTAVFAPDRNGILKSVTLNGKAWTLEELAVWDGTYRVSAREELIMIVEYVFTGSGTAAVLSGAKVWGEDPAEGYTRVAFLSGIDLASINKSWQVGFDISLDGGKTWCTYTKSGVNTSVTAGSTVYTPQYEEQGVRIFGEDAIRIFYECVMFKQSECSGKTVLYRPFSLAKDLKTRVFEGVVSSIVLP